jgi:hypothetical protein
MKRIALLVLLCIATDALGVTRDVTDDDSFTAALRQAQPGDVIRLGPGTFRGGRWFDISGTEQKRITIEAADPRRPPTIEGGNNGLHMGGTSYITVRNLRFHGQRDNGINCDDGGRRDRMARGLVLENLHVSDVGAHGNHDSIKLSGLADFVVRNCTVEGWGGSAVDMVGCHDGVIEDCTFRGKEGFDTGNGVQAKGGSANITIRRCDFTEAGMRAINCGGSTGLQFFRPPDATAEAREITIEHCRSVGSETPIAFVGVDGALFQRNTLYHPRKWVLRILQETVGDRFVACRNVRFERNLIVFNAAQVRTHVNIGPNTEPQTFTFFANHWYCENAPGQSHPRLPTAEEQGIHGRDPGISLDDQGLPTTRLKDVGAAPRP